MAEPSLLLFRSDLRVQDNPALLAAMQAGGPVVALFVFDEESQRAFGGASKYWLHHALVALEKSLDALGVKLIIRVGASLEIIQGVAQAITAQSLFWNRTYDKSGVALGQALKTWAGDKGLRADSFDGCLLHEPSLTKTKTGGYFKVFTPFWKAYCQTSVPRDPLPSPEPQAPYAPALQSLDIGALKLLPTQPNWAEDFDPLWQPGEAGAHKALDQFLTNGLSQYSDGRDVPSIEATSRLSPYLRFGEISPHQIWFKARQHERAVGTENLKKFFSEIGWREFAHHLLFHNPDLKDVNYNAKFDDFPWFNGPEKSALLKAWQKGQTGYPIVDAGMRQLWQTGWMHNRVRMIVGSFLVKHLLIDWREGERWFWDTLLDACPANNTASWQWVAGTGADAAPYFRVFNPVLQGEKFDPQGVYVKRYVPELSNLPDKIIHKPWTGRESELAHFGVTLGTTYPNPIVDHSFARERALDAFNTTKSEAA